MRIFSIMGVGVAVSAAALLAGAAHAEERCASRDVSIYFEKGEASINEFSQVVVERVAAEAKACGAVHVFADAPDGSLQAPRAQALAAAFADKGVNVVVVGAPRASPTRTLEAESVLDRSASVRVLVAPALS